MQIAFLSHCWHVLFTFFPKSNRPKCNGCWRGTENIKSPILPPQPPQKNITTTKLRTREGSKNRHPSAPFSQDGSQIFTCVDPSSSKCERHFPLPPSTAGKDRAFLLFSAAPCGAGTGPVLHNDGDGFRNVFPLINEVLLYRKWIHFVQEDWAFRRSHLLLLSCLSI